MNTSKIAWTYVLGVSGLLAAWWYFRPTSKTHVPELHPSQVTWAGH